MKHSPAFSPGSIGGTIPAGHAHVKRHVPCAAANGVGALAPRRGAGNGGASSGAARRGSAHRRGAASGRAPWRPERLRHWSVRIREGSSRCRRERPAADLRSRRSAPPARRALRCAANRERLRDELKAISVDVLAQTGDSLAAARRPRRAAPSRSAPAARWPARAEEIKGIVRPVQEKLGRMESEIGRLERERRQAQGELAQMVRQLGEGVGTLRQETGNLVSALKRPSTRGSWGEIQLRNVVEMAGMVSHCDFVEQSTIQTDDGRAAPGHARAPARRQARRRRLEGAARRLPLGARGRRRGRARAARAPATRARRASTSPSSPSKGYQRQFDSTPEFVVMFVPSDGIYQAALAAGPGADRVRRPAAGADGDADDADRPAVGGPLRLAPGADRRVRARDRRVRARAAPPPRALRRAARARSGASSTRRSAPTTRRSAPSTTA